MTTEAWERVDMATLRRRYAENMAKSRAEAHRKIDEFFDGLAAEQELRWEIMRRDVEGTPQH
jgi:hypothetical protein